MAITAALSVPCAARSGGISEVYLVDKADVSTFTLVGGAYTAVTMIGGVTFKKFEFEDDTCEMKSDASRENGSVKMTHSLEFMVPKLTQTNRERLQELCDSSSCGIIAIVKDANATYWVMGYNELIRRALKMSSIAGTSGKAFTDLTGSTVTLMNENNELNRPYTGSIPGY